MKTVTLIIFFFTSAISIAQVPNWNEVLRQKKTQKKYLIQQIAALTTYIEYLKKGYAIADKGLTTIGDIKEGTFNLDKNYFNSLKEVSPIVRQSPKVNDILICQQRITHDMRKLVDEVDDDTYLTPPEISYVHEVYQNMLSECNASIDELTLITTAGETEMKDDERLARLDKVHQDMQDRLSFTNDFIQSAHAISRHRAKEKQQIDRSKKVTHTDI